MRLSGAHQIISCSYLVFHMFLKGLRRVSASSIDLIIKIRKIKINKINPDSDMATAAVVSGAPAAPVGARSWNPNFRHSDRERQVINFCNIL